MVKIRYFFEAVLFIHKEGTKSYMSLNAEGTKNKWSRCLAYSPQTSLANTRPKSALSSFFHGHSVLNRPPARLFLPLLLCLPLSLSVPVCDLRICVFSHTPTHTYPKQYAVQKLLGRFSHVCLRWGLRLQL